MSQLLDRLIELSGLEVTIERDPGQLRPADAPKIAGDSARLRALGWTPRRDIDDALLALLHWAKARLQVTQNL
jgi:nucleoside-diphosphate-sugar epimerase